MDQLKPILEGLSKHRFWVACSLIALSGLVVWFLASSSVADQRAKLMSEIQTSFSNTSALSGIDPKEGLTGIPEGVNTATVFPNQTTIEEMDRLTDEAKIAAREAWEFQYQKQQQLLVFPADLPENVRSAFSQYLPIESRLPRYNESTPNQEARVEFRSAYGDYIRERLPQLAEMIGARWAPSAAVAATGSAGSTSGIGSSPGAGSAPGGTMGPMGSSPGGATGTAEPTEDDTQYVVNWNPANQGYWLSASTSFTGRNGNTSSANQPTTHQVMYLQEDLWVLEAIFSVIKGVNGDADANDLATIKTIDHILVGASAGKIGGTATLDSAAGTPQAQGSAAMTPDAMMRMGMPGSSGSGGGGGGGGGNAASRAAAADFADPTNLRYVDRNFEPLSASDFFDSLNATSPEDAYLQVAKRIPVRLGFRMKETALLDLLARCANSTPPIEVHQVRINRHKPEAGTLAGGAGGGGMSGAGSGDGGGAPMGPLSAAMGGGGQSMGASVGQSGPGGGGSGSGQSTRGAAAPVETDVVGVEIYGVVYIFNPVPGDSDETNILKLANPPAEQAADRRVPAVAVAN